MITGHAICHGSAGSGGQHVPLAAPHALQLSEKGSGELRHAFINTHQIPRANEIMSLETSARNLTHRWPAKVGGAFMMGEMGPTTS